MKRSMGLVLIACLCACAGWPRVKCDRNGPTVEHSLLGIEAIVNSYVPPDEDEDEDEDEVEDDAKVSPGDAGEVAPEDDAQDEFEEYRLLILQESANCRTNAHGHEYVDEAVCRDVDLAVVYASTAKWKKCLARLQHSRTSVMKEGPEAWPDYPVPGPTGMRARDLLMQTFYLANGFIAGNPGDPDLAHRQVINDRIEACLEPSCNGDGYPKADDPNDPFGTRDNPKHYASVQRALAAAQAMDWALCSSELEHMIGSLGQ